MTHEMYSHTANGPIFDTMGLFRYLWCWHLKHESTLPHCWRWPPPKMYLQHPPGNKQYNAHGNDYRFTFARVLLDFLKLSWWSMLHLYREKWGKSFMYIWIHMSTFWWLDVKPDIVLTHWNQMTHICVSKLTIIGSDNGLSSCRRQANIWTKAGILLIRNLKIVSS